MKWCRVLIFLSYVHLTRSSKISRQGKNRRHGCYKRQGTAVEWMSPWSDWKVRQGRAYSVTLPPACGRRQGYRIMPCPFGLSSHSRRPNQDCKKFTWNALFMDLGFIIHHHNHNFNHKSCNHRYPGLSIGFACTCRSCPAYLGTESRNYRAYFVYRSSKGHLWVYANGDHFFVEHPSFHCAKEIKGMSMYFWSVSLTGQQSH